MDTGTLRVDVLPLEGANCTLHCIGMWNGHPCLIAGFRLLLTGGIHPLNIHLSLPV